MNIEKKKLPIYDLVVPTEKFSVSSKTIQAEKEIPLQYLGTEKGGNQSPDLSWSGFNKEKTKSFAVSIYDADAPTGSGFWHWAIYDIPANITYLKENAGSADHKLLPEGIKTIKNDARLPFYVGPAPAKGTGTHHYVITVTALDVEKLEIDSEATPAMLGLVVASHTVGRARIIPVATAESR